MIPSAPSEPLAGLPLGQLGQWLAQHEPQLPPPSQATLVTGGRSNLTYIIECGAQTRIVLRRPPHGSRHGGAHDVLREHRILAALYGTAVPVPLPLAACPAPDVIGAPFYLMEYVDGQVIDGSQRVEAYSPGQRRRLGMELMTTLASLHAVIPAERGLADLSPPGSYTDRQLRRWSRQWEAYQTRELPALAEALQLLHSARPAPSPRALVHQDYRLGNVIAGPGGGIQAVLDWELAVLGDPAADLGYLGARLAASAATLAPHGEPLGLPGFPSFSQLIDRYERAAGAAVHGLGYHIALAAMRWTVIAEGIYLRFERGMMGAQPADLQFLRRRVELLAEFTLSCAQRMG